MNNRDDEFLNTLYKKRKQLRRASDLEKQKFTDTLVTKARKTSQLSWFFRMQFTLSIVAVCLLGVIMFDQTQTSRHTTPITDIDEAVYYQVAVVERQSTNLSWSVSQKKQSLEQYRDDQLAKLNMRFNSKGQNIQEPEIIAVKVLNTSDDWYLETCDGQTLIKIQRDVVLELMHSQTLFNNTLSGQWLALQLDNHGSPKSLFQTTKATNANVC